MSREKCLPYKGMILDMFCGGGGASVGYHRAGFKVVGVDIKPQPNYPFEFIQDNALAYAAIHGHKYAAIHASPPCQRYSIASNGHDRTVYPDLVQPTREVLRAIGRPYVIENVVGSPLVKPLILCGQTFGLRVFRHRLFEIKGFKVPNIPHEKHIGSCGDQPGRPGIRGFVTVAGHISNKAICQKAMGINWMSARELVQAIPPKYTEYIGSYL